MFACLGFRPKHKRLISPTQSQVELITPLNGSPTLPNHHTHTPAPLHPRPTPQGTPLPRRSSFRRKSFSNKKRFSDPQEIEFKYPVKPARPAVNAIPAGTRGPGTVNGTVHSARAKEETLRRLEAEIEARKVEVRVVREEKEEVTKAVEALTVLLHHLATTYDPFNTPRLKEEVRRVNSQLTETKLSLDETTASLRRLQEEEEEERRRHRQEMEAVRERHERKVEQITQEHKHELDLALEKHRKELTKFAEDQQTQREEVSRAHTAEVEQLEGEWRTKLDVQHERHLCALQELNTKHMHQIRELESSKRARERELEETNFRLQEEQKTLKIQSKELEETLLNDTDHRLAAVRKKCASLNSEVDSLKSVVEMKNSEIHTLRSQVVEIGRLTTDLEIARERAKSLQAKTEDLQAQMEKKAQVERSLVNEHRLLVETCQRETSVNKRLSLENEELAWKLRQREERVMSISAPPAATSTATTAATTLDIPSRSPASPRSSTPLGTSRTPRVTANTSRTCVSPCKSEPAGRRRYRVSGGGCAGLEAAVGGVGGAGGVAGGCGSPPNSPCVKAVVEKSNSVSFILDLTGQGEETNGPVSPRRRPHRTASLSAADRPRTHTHTFTRRTQRTTHTRTRANTLTTQADMNGGLNGRSASESSESGSPLGSRTSPTPSGLAWTVPVHANPQTQPRPAPRQLLQDPQEDEYESGPQDATPRFLDTPGLISSSENASDSELSQCSLKGASTSTSDTDSDGADTADHIADGNTHPAPKLCPKIGAGEAMIPDDLLEQYGGGMSPPARGPLRRRLPSAPSSDSDENTTPHNDDDDDDGVGAKGDVSWSEDVDVTSSSEMHDLL